MSPCAPVAPEESLALTPQPFNLPTPSQGHGAPCPPLTEKSDAPGSKATPAWNHGIRSQTVGQGSLLATVSQAGTQITLWPGRGGRTGVWEAALAPGSRSWFPNSSVHWHHACSSLTHPCWSPPVHGHILGLGFLWFVSPLAATMYSQVWD